MNRRICLLILILSLMSGISHTQNNSLSKLDPALRAKLDRQAVSLSKAMDEILDVFIQTDAPDALEPFGVRIRSTGGGWATADAPLSALSRISELKEVTAIRMSETCHPQLDQSIPEIRADAVWSTQHLRGSGVIIGIIDTGIDWTHPDFKNPDGSTRVLYLWDQTDNSGSPPSEFASDPGSSYRHTTEYRETDINNELSGLTVNSIQSRDTDGHGTHVAGIAAGNGLGTDRGQPAETYVGVAPEASLIVVKTNMSSTWIADGIDYIFRKAGALGKPAVVNLSLGHHEGGHDGTNPLEQRIDASLLGKKGRFVTVAAGNDGDRPFHAKALSTDFVGGNLWTTRLEILENPTGTSDQLRLQAYGPVVSNYSITVVTPNGTRIGPVSAGSRQIWPNALQPMVLADNAGAVNTSTQDREIWVQLSDVAKLAGVEDFPMGTWTFEFRGAPGRIDAWISSSTIQAGFSQPDYSTLVTIPGTAIQCMTVGSYISRVSWPNLNTTDWVKTHPSIGDIAPSSSPGPTRPTSANPTPLQKPEIVCPGTAILSSLSQWMSPYPTSDLISPDGRHRAEGGTSMSAPHIAGLAALMFQADPTLSAAEIRNWIMLTARKDAFTGSATWRPQWGYGKADAEAALLRMPVESIAIASVPVKFEFSNYPNPFNASTLIEWSIPLDRNAELEILDMSGRLVKRWTKLTNESGSSRILWDGKDETGKTLPSGMYVARIMDLKTIHSTKMVLIK